MGFLHLLLSFNALPPKLRFPPPPPQTTQTQPLPLAVDTIESYYRPDPTNSVEEELYPQTENPSPVLDQLHRLYAFSATGRVKVWVEGEDDLLTLIPALEVRVQQGAFRVFSLFPFFILLFTWLCLAFSFLFSFLVSSLLLLYLFSLFLSLC